MQKIKTILDLRNIDDSLSYEAEKKIKNAIDLNYNVNINDDESAVYIHGGGYVETVDLITNEYFYRLADLIEEKIQNYIKENNIVLQNNDYYFRCAVIRDSRDLAYGNFMTIEIDNYKRDPILNNKRCKLLYELLEKKELNLKVYTFKNTSNVVLITDNDVEVDEEHCIVSFFNERNVSTQYFDYYDYYYYAYDYTYKDIDLKSLQERGER
ncbi:hypothetical protein [Fusobacterium necrophorum]|uniref:hypothetical protein n=1 Tax=Fusobacterium necrophorum TaxID=859 RepID=UPI0007879991|nr:hypothetical protein [Fusobacterium necrophorum]AYV95965.1 hypothetical protein BWX37_10170 [Fusobacterium necrophorum subsp. funduliforme]KYL02759.1 hypothetical protein A2J06_10530 [Fusobacterium necrophorum subsp. funduliforme]